MRSLYKVEQTLGVQYQQPLNGQTYNTLLSSLRNNVAATSVYSITTVTTATVIITCCTACKRYYYSICYSCYCYNCTSTAASTTVMITAATAVANITC